jgi:hypothetical protein
MITMPRSANPKTLELSVPLATLRRLVEVTADLDEQAAVTFTEEGQSIEFRPSQRRATAPAEESAA